MSVSGTWRLPCAMGWLIWSVLSWPAAGQDLIRLTQDGQFKHRPSWSRDGRRLVYARHEAEMIRLVELTLADRTERVLTGDRHPQYDGVYSPDGQWLAISHDATSPNQGNLELYLLKLDDGKTTPLVTDDKKLSHEEYPDWSPDGEQLVFTSTRHGNQEIYLVRRDGTDLRRLTTHPGVDAHPAWSPDGRTIAFSTDRWGDLDLALMDVDGTHVRRIAAHAGLDDYPAWSPDGRRLAFASQRSGDLEVYVWSGDEQVENVSRHPGQDSFPTWRPDGSLTFVSNRDGGFEIYLRPAVPPAVEPE